MSTADRCPNCGEKIMEHRIVEGTREGSTLYICKTVPRVAESADDLQVGQAVAVCLAPENWWVGIVRRDGHGDFICDRGHENGLVLFGWNSRTVIILAEPEPDPDDVVEVPRAAYEDLVNGVEAMGDRPPTSRAEWMARDLVKAVEER